MIRSPICAVVGHVDHGKTSLLDAVRGTTVAAGEAGAITQAIGASIIPIEHIKKRASHMLDGKNTSIPGLLFIDTPGHAAFTSMRKRGGSLADIAILLVDINEGFMPQTKEALDILRNYKTPFIVAANKVDLARGFLKRDKPLAKLLAEQQEATNQYLETKLYEIVGTLAEAGFQSERFDRIDSFEKQIAIVPVSATEGIGIDTLLALIVGLAQRFLEKSLEATVKAPAKGTVLEVTEDKGMGTTLNAIIYDGTLNVGDEIVIAGLDKPITTKVRALMQPNTLGDIRDRKTRFVSVDKAEAATGVKIAAPGLDGVLAGMPFVEINSPDAEHLEEAVQDVTIETEQEGVIIKADNVGSLEALITLLREKNIPIRAARVGSVTKRDLTQAAAQEKQHAVVLAFNVEGAEQAKQEGVQVFFADIIYKLIDDYEQYQQRVERETHEARLQSLNRPGRVRVLDGCIFRQSSPCVIGVEVEGRITKGAMLTSTSDATQRIGYIKEIQDKSENLQEASGGMQVAISIPGAVAGRHIKEGDTYWVSIDEEEFRALKEYKKQLSGKEIELLKEYAELQRKQNPLWGV